MKSIEVCRVAHYLPVENLKAHPDNPRTIKPDRLRDLKDSIIKKGFYKPILVWKKGGIVLEGNHRVQAAKELITEGYEFITESGEVNSLPVVVEDCSVEQAEAILYDSNNNYAEWVEEKLTKALKEAEDLGRDIKDYGFTQDFVDNLLNNAIKEAEVLTDAEDLDPILGETSESGSVDEEDYETLVLPRDAHEKLVKLLKSICAKKVEGWAEGDSLSEAVLILCEYVEKSDLFPKKRKT